MSRIVLDTNIVLDCFVFQDPATQALQTRLAAGTLQWLATPAMRDELARVLDYPQIARRLRQRALDAADVLARFDALATLQAAVPKAPVTCKDPDDQKFIDLAVAQQARLLSKDYAVLCMKKRLLALDVQAQKALE